MSEQEQAIFTRISKQLAHMRELVEWLRKEAKAIEDEIAACQKFVDQHIGDITRLSEGNA